MHVEVPEEHVLFGGHMRMQQLGLGLGLAGVAAMLRRMLYLNGLGVYQPYIEEQQRIRQSSNAPTASSQ